LLPKSQDAIREKIQGITTVLKTKSQFLNPRIIGLMD